ncbi:MAG: hypothetical protein R3E66_13835 [bacterium]
MAIWLFSANAFADVEVIPTALRDYALPSNFGLANSIIASGKDETTYLANTTGEGGNVRCTVVVATKVDAREIDYAVDGRPTRCLSLVANPNGGFFLRADNPQAMPGDVTGITAYVDANGVEQWKIRDTQLVDAQARPSGTGVFLGSYAGAFDTMVYSPQTDRLLAFTIGRLSINQEDKFIAQGHVVDVATGDLLRSGQSIGQAGLGIPIAATVRTDGVFTIAFDTLGSQGLVFYTYDGRETVEELEPLSERWEDRVLIQMFWAEETLNFVWLDPTDASVSTEVAITNATGNALLRQTFTSTYRFADGAFVALGAPTNAWRDAEYLTTSYVSDGLVYLRLITPEGESPGMGRLDGITSYTPAAVVSGPQGLRFLAFDAPSNRIYEYALSFMDAPDYNPDMGLADVDIPDIGLGDVLDEVGCGCSSVARARTPAGIVLLVLGALIWRRR